MADKVVPITKAKKIKQDQIPTAEYYRMMCNHINGRVSALFGYSTEIGFPNRYYLTNTDDEDRSLLIEYDEHVVKYCKPIKLKSDLVQFVSEYLFNHEFFSTITERGVSDIYRYWELYTQPILPPRSFKFWSESGLCFHRMLFDPIPDDGTNCPLFKEIAGRMSTNREAFLAFLGSIFIPSSNRQQYLYIHGEGQNGKGSLIRLLQKCLGPAFASRKPPNKNNGDIFWNAPLRGKRLVAFSDCDQPDFPMSENFKMLTGGDPIPMRLMQKEEFTAEIDCKFIFASNYQLEISGQKSDQRRAIYCLLEDSECEMSPTYETKLWMEARYIVGWCINEYHKACPNGETIPVDEEVNRDLADDVDADMIGLFKNYFNLVRNAAAPSSEISRLFKFEFNGMCGQKIRKFRKWVKSYHGLKFGRIYLGQQRVRVLHGAVLKEGTSYKYNTDQQNWYEI